MKSIFFRLNYPSQPALDKLVAGATLSGLAPDLAMNEVL